MHWHGVVMKLNERGECIGMLEDCAPFLHIVCDSLEVDDTLYVATLYTDLWAFNTKQLPSTSTWAHNRTMK
ncbi:hypothetical protein Pelo_16093 [Pelomyxa schiedti]|nr:hypothetical protein Pelo_16093 [Pelomyxa schiedti]